MADATTIRTAAETGLATAFAGLKGKLPGDAARRAAAFAKFEAEGLPHRRVEDYKYTDLRALIRAVPPSAERVEPAAARAAAETAGLIAGVARHRLVFVNGVYEPALSDKLDKIVAVEPLDAGETGPLALSQPARHDPVVGLNTAFLRDGIAIRVAKGARIDKPIEIAHVFTGEAAIAHLRHMIRVEAGATASFIESWSGPAGVDYQINAVVELDIGEDASVSYVKLQTEGAKAIHLGTLVARLAARAGLDHFVFNTGAAVARSQVFLAFAGEGARLDARGATLIKDRQHSDITLFLDHAVPHCQSRETFKAALDGESRSVFQGKIVVRPHAQKTDARMMSQALLLSETAEADNKPELEIYADDVQCGHGATAGALDDNLKFYLMSRGIPEKEAETLLIQAFVGEAIDAIANEDVKEALTGAVTAWLRARG